MSRLLRRWTSAAMLQWLVWGTLLLGGLTLPTGQFLMRWQFHQGELAADAHLRAHAVSQRIVANPQMWQFEELRLRDSLSDRQPSGHAGDLRRVLDSRGAVLAEWSSGAPRWPLVEQTETLFDNGRPVGRLLLQRSLWPELQRAALTGAASLSVAVLIALLLVSAPLRLLREAERELEHKAYHDNLTGLYNRDAFRRLLREGLALARRDQRPLAVLYIDLDRFKSINDTLGHDAGDDALREVARRLSGSVRSEDIVARLSGDEFAVLVEASHGTAQALAASLLERFATPFELGGRLWTLGCSVGLALYPDHADEAGRLLNCADTAMLHAKAGGRSRSMQYHEGLEESELHRHEIEQDLRGALERREFVLHFQPLVGLADGRLQGAEALLRWQHPQRGLVPPIEFVALLEEMGQIHAVGHWVLKEACLQMQRWLAAGACIDKVAVNVSPRQFARQSDFVEQVRLVLEETGLPPQHLQLEITEGALMAHDHASLAVLNELRALGVSLAIDDFGTGYSSLAYLRRFPVQVLKIDRCFVRDMLDSPQDANIVRAIVQMAHSLGMRVTAEGVEHRGQRDALAALGCETGQGFALGRPMASDALLARLERQDAAPAPRPAAPAEPEHAG